MAELDGEAAVVDETDRMVPGRLVRRDRRRRRAQDEVLRPGDGRLARRVRPAHRDERLLRTPRRAPRLRRQGRRRGAAVPVPRVAVEPARAATSASRTRIGPTAAGASAPTRSSSATSRSTSGTTSTAASRTSTRPTCSPASTTAAAPTTTTRSSGCTARAWNCIRSTCSKTAWTSRISSTCTTPRSCRCSPATTSTTPVSYVDFTITFEGDDGQRIEDVNSGVEAINGGLGIAVTKSWGMVDNRTISAITPVDESTSDVRFMVYIGRTPGKDPARAERQGGRIRTRSDPAVRAGHRHLAAPALLGSARAGHRRVRGLHRNPQVGQAVLSRRHRWQRRRSLCSIQKG